MQMLIIVLNRLYLQNLHFVFIFTFLLVIHLMFEKRYRLTSFQNIAKTVSIKFPRFLNIDNMKKSEKMSMTC